MSWKVDHLFIIMYWLLKLTETKTMNLGSFYAMQ